MKIKITSHFVKRFTVMLVGNLLIGLGVALMRLADFGNDPFACMNMGVSSHLPLSYGTYQMILNWVLFAVVIILYPKSFGVGALINMVGLGYEVEFFLWLSRTMGITMESLSSLYVARIPLLLIGITVICLGVALYVQSDMGAAPYDVAGDIVEQRTKGKISYRVTRVALDLISIVIGWISGGPLGFATFIVGFFTGPLVTFFRKSVAVPLLKGPGGVKIKRAL